MNASMAALSYLFIGEEGGQERNGVYIYDEVGATVPATRLKDINSCDQSYVRAGHTRRIGGHPVGIGVDFNSGKH